MELMFPTAPLELALSMTTRSTCDPAGRLTPVFVTVVQDCQPPVLGIVIGPVLSTPFDSMWNVPPAPDDATRMSNVYVPAVATLTVYFNHSPGAIQPTL